MDNMAAISPVGVKLVDKQSVAPRLDTLEGKTIGETWNMDFKGDIMFPIYRELLKERFPGVKIVPYTEFPRSVLSGMPEYQKEVSQQIANSAKEKGCDAMISGNGG
ncbi:MAG TPA: hypothetical protein HPQ03_09605 [Deltaproteobacteria bacterium]|nr:hypothetical protein [Deltaproteobacteria bacterium]